MAAVDLGLCIVKGIAESQRGLISDSAHRAPGDAEPRWPVRLMLGVAASSATKTGILVTGLAGLVAGAMCMTVGEYVWVSSQRDAERADIVREKGS